MTAPEAKKAISKKKSDGKLKEHSSSKGAKKATGVRKGSNASEKVAAANGATRKHRRTETYGRYIHRVLKSVHPDLGLSKKAMAIVECFIQDIFDKVAVESGKLCQYSSKETLTSREIQSAVRLVLPGDLAKHAVDEGTKAVQKFNK